ncbi:serine hydrolase domain-containing protein [Kribbella kalugense]|uniref:CubicO group peptidase (Beta-lactamase class C family) n=1 Tax=Kribbella kalugense TaxID=2512221 RepID=A0A4R8A274_9ACTN|nr:serine hydrolase domain-containing protein [Kribbella kalugense]TDW24637.1 CubicO group peptidase (beta-lactamase class C family) [Kribbella kalugense]
MATDRLGELLENVVPDPRGPGVVVGLVGPDGSLETAARGMAVLEHDVPIADDTVFHLASLSKQFTAEAVQVLVREGAVGVDDPIADYLPWMPFKEVSVDQLIRHRSGLRDQWELVEAAGGRMEDVITTADLIELIRRQTALQDEPGARYAYSNTNYTLLGLLIETVTGERLDTFCRKQFFEPLGMDDTRFVDNHRAVVRRRASSYQRIADGYERIVLSYGTAGATSLHSTVTDLARWAAAVSSRESWRGTTYTGSDSYGWGVHIGEHAGHLKLWHAGADAGFRTHLAMVPGIGSAVVLGNFAELDPDPLADRVLGLIEPGRAEQLAGTYYCDELTAVVRVVLDEGGLALERPRYGRRTMTPAGERRFTVRTDDAESPEIALTFDQAGVELGYSTEGVRGLVFRRFEA